MSYPNSLHSYDLTDFTLRSYFCRPYIQGYFLERPDHARFIDTDVLEEYYPVGGVRIEDVILIKKDGNENLSWGAPKGKELEDVINGWDKEATMGLTQSFDVVNAKQSVPFVVWPAIRE